MTTGLSLEAFSSYMKWLNDNSKNLFSIAILACFVFLLTLNFDIYTVWKTHTISKKEIIKIEGHAYFLSYNLPYSDFSKTSRLKVIEDGSPLLGAHSRHDLIKTLGQGRFSHWKNAVYFSSSDNTSPLENGRIYKLLYPWKPDIKLLLLFGVLSFLLNLQKLKGVVDLIDNKRPIIVLTALVLLAIIYRVFIGTLQWEGTFHGVQIKGLPYSDALGWFDLGANYANGVSTYSTEYWDARRHGYAWFLGSVFSVFGESLNPVRIIQLIFSTLSIVLIFDSLRRFIPVSLAIIATLTHAFLTYDVLSSLTSMSEPLGYFLTNLAIWLLITGMLSNKPIPGKIFTYWLLMLSGAVFAYSNLVRPLNLLATIVISIFIIYYFAGKYSCLRDKLRFGSIPAIAFILGLMIVISPWIARQYTTHGILAITDNSVEMLYAATSPEFGIWSSAVTRKAESDNPETKNSISERYHYFKNGVNENLDRNLSWYITRSITITLNHLQQVAPDKWSLLAVLLIFLLRFGLTENGNAVPRTFLVCFFIAASILLIPTFLYTLFTVLLSVGGMIYALLRQHIIAVLGIIILMTVSSLGFMAAANELRFNYSLYWLTTAFDSWVLWILLYRFTMKKESLDEFINYNNSVKIINNTLLKLLIIIPLVIFASGIIRIIYNNMASPPYISSAVTDLTTYHVINDFLSDTKIDYFSKWKSKMIVRKINFRKGMEVSLDTLENTNHWSPLFSGRLYPYTIRYTNPPITGESINDIPVTMVKYDLANEKKYNTAYYLIGFYHYRPSGNSFEVIGITPINEKGHRWLTPDENDIQSHYQYLSTWIE